MLVKPAKMEKARTSSMPGYRKLIAIPMMMNADEKPIRKRVIQQGLLIGSAAAVFRAQDANTIESTTASIAIANISSVDFSMDATFHCACLCTVFTYLSIGSIGAVSARSGWWIIGNKWVC